MKKKIVAVKNVKEIVKRIQNNFDDLKSLKVKHIYIFGSFVRNQQTKNSDIDLLIEFSEAVGFFAYYDVKVFLENILGRKIDLVLKESLRPEFQEQVEQELIIAS